MGIPLAGPIRSAFSSSVASGRPSSRSIRSMGLFSPKAVPTLLEGRYARVAAADLEGNDAPGKGEGLPRGGWVPPPARSRAPVADRGQRDRRRRGVDHLSLLHAGLP